MRTLAVAALAALQLAAAGLAAGSLAGCSTTDARARLVRAPPRCADQTVQVYFEPWSAELTREGRLVIDAAATGLRGCRIAEVEVLGLADAPGAPEANLELSRKRAQAVSAALAATGLAPAQIRLSAAGDVGAVTPQGQVAPLRRRVDVILRVAGP